jgi:hypothetical protein
MERSAMNTQPDLQEPGTRDECLRVLSGLRRGELAAVATYSQAIVKDGSAGMPLVQLRCGHEDAAALLQKRITELGGRVDATGGIWEAFARSVEGAAKVFGNDAATAALHVGEKHGVDGYTRALANQRVDAESRHLLRGALVRQQASLGALEGLVGVR